jgi:hypothetical protein
MLLSAKPSGALGSNQTQTSGDKTGGYWRVVPIFVNLRHFENQSVMNDSPLDFEVSFEGPVVFFRPVTETARQWLATHFPNDENHHYLFGALFVDSRFAADLIRRARHDGLEV